MNSYPNDLEIVLLEILSEHTTCIAREIIDRAHIEHLLPFESFRNLRETRDTLVAKGEIQEVSKDSPYGKPYKFYHLSVTNRTTVNWMIIRKHRLLSDYARHTAGIGHFGEDLVASALERLGYTEVEARKPLSKRDIDVFCRDRNEDFYWAIECKNRRQEINENDIDDAFENAERASSKWNINVKPALVSSSVYNRIPEEDSMPILRTGSMYVPSNDFFKLYQDSLGAWFLELVNSMPNALVELIEEELKN